MRAIWLSLVVLLLPSVAFAGRWYDATDYANAALAPGGGTNYYVDGTNGSDDNDGLTFGNAFKTIKKATDKNLGAGTRVLIATGVYRERPNLENSDSGTAGNRTMIGAYGNGPVVLDSGWDISTWTNLSGEIYYADNITSVQGVVVDEVPLKPLTAHGTACTPASVTEGTYCFDSGASRVYVWAPGGGTPASPTHDTGVIMVDLYRNGFAISSANYITIYGITVRFAAGHGLSLLGNNLTVELSRFIFNSKAGVNAFTYETNYSTGMQLLKNEVKYNCMTNWPRGRMTWLGWAMGAVMNGVGGALFQGNVAHNNGGEGLGAYGDGGGGGAIMRDNIAYDNWSVNLYPHQRDMLIERNHVYANPIDSSDLDNNGDPTPEDAISLKRLRPVGILFANESVSGYTRNLTIRNNIIVDCRRGIDTYMGPSVPDGGIINDNIYNNTIIVPVTAVEEEVAGNVIAGMVVPHYDGHNTGSEIRNNIIYGTDSYSFLMYRSDDPGDTTRFDGLTFTDNAFYHSGRADPIHWGPSSDSAYDLTHVEWLALSGDAHGTDDVTSDPTLVDPDTVVALDKALIVGSPAIDEGYAVAVDDDWELNARATIDIGALEYDSTPGGTTLAVTTTVLSDAIKGSAYSGMAVATGGTTPYTWDISAGAICSGLSLSAAGAITGTPDTDETCNFTARVTDDLLDTATAALSITVVTAISNATLISVNPGSTTAVVTIGAAGLPSTTECTVEIFTDPDISNVQAASSGNAMREAFFAGISPATTLVARGRCLGFSDEASVSFTTFPLSGGQSGNVSWPEQFEPMTLLTDQSVAKVTVEYQVISPQLADVETSTNASCGSGCTETLTLVNGTIYKLRHVWLTAGGDTVATSRPRYYAVP